MTKRKSSSTQGPFARKQVIELYVPFPVWNLCKLLDVEPSKIVHDLLSSIGSPVKFGEFGETSTCQEATEFFLKQRYGQDYYTKGEVRQMIAELGVVEGIIPSFDTSYDKIFNDWLKMRDMYLKVWQSKWKDKQKRKPLV